MNSNEQDILKGRSREIQIGEHGIVRLVDCMPRLVGPGRSFDHAVCEAARVSYGENEKVVSAKTDRGLIRYLMRHRHGTPFEMVDIKFYMRLPIFVVRQMIRHRTASINEYSMRYKQPKERFFVPSLDEVTLQSTDNKQGSAGPAPEDLATQFINHTKRTAADATAAYQAYDNDGLAKEVNRINLPLSTFTEWYWEIDLRNLLHFLSLRMESHAQRQIRDYANAMCTLCRPLAPHTFEAFDDFMLNAISLSALEIEALRGGRDLDERATDRERAEYKDKLRKLGMNPAF